MPWTESFLSGDTIMAVQPAKPKMLIFGHICTSFLKNVTRSVFYHSVVITITINEQFLSANINCLLFFT